ncbi:hypothetical protein GCM10023116_33200 [Kistimonas scapharcae]|uniref:Group 1 truncated hemoglobin n=1 Tax=Kistimonas scapharcae TaxID=1036133 RepID=A0ABP8V5G7_9GAMM
MASLYERLGGDKAILLAVSVFYDKVADDPVIGHYFSALDMDKLARKQAAFMSTAFGGPLDDDVRGLREAHAGLGITDEEFDIVVRYLSETLTEIGVEDALKNEVMGIVSTTRSDVVEIQASEGASSDGA